MAKLHGRLNFDSGLTRVTDADRYICYVSCKSVDSVEWSGIGDYISSFDIKYSDGTNSFCGKASGSTRSVSFPTNGGIQAVRAAKKDYDGIVTIRFYTLLAFDNEPYCNNVTIMNTDPSPWDLG